MRFDDICTGGKKSNESPHARRFICNSKRNHSKGVAYQIARDSSLEMFVRHERRGEADLGEKMKAEISE